MGLSDFFDDVADFVSDIPIVGKVFDVIRDNPRTSLLLAAGIGGIAAMGGFSGLLGTGGATAGATETAAAGVAETAAATGTAEAAVPGLSTFESSLAGAKAAALGSPEAAAPSFIDTLTSGAGKIGQAMFGTPTRTMVTGQLLQGAGSYISAEQQRKQEQQRYEEQMALAREQMARSKVNVVGGPITATSFRSAGPIGSAMNSNQSVSMSPSEALHLRRTGQL